MGDIRFLKEIIMAVRISKIDPKANLIKIEKNAGIVGGVYIFCLLIFFVSFVLYVLFGLYALIDPFGGGCLMINFVIWIWWTTAKTRKYIKAIEKIEKMDLNNLSEEIKEEMQEVEDEIENAKYYNLESDDWI